MACRMIVNIVSNNPTEKMRTSPIHVFHEYHRPYFVPSNHAEYTFIELDFHGPSDFRVEEFQNGV